MTTTAQMIRTFSDATRVLVAHGYHEPQSIGGKLWSVAGRPLDKGGVIALARDLAKEEEASAPPRVPADGTPEPALIAIDQIRGDGGTQARAALDPVTIAEYAAIWQELSYQPNGLDQMPPIVLYHDGESYWLADGFHRVAAYRQFLQDGKPSASPHAIRADVRQGTRRDAVLFACGANASHGLRRTSADKRRAIETLLRDDEWRQWSDSEIARRCNVDHKTVAKTREDLYPGISQDSRTVQRGDTTYQQKTPAKPNIPEAGPDLADILTRLDAHGYAKSSARQKGSTTFYTFRDYRSGADDDSAGVLELAEGELLFWLAELDANEARSQERRAAFQDARDRFAALGWQLDLTITNNKRMYVLTDPSGKHIGTNAQLDPLLKMLAQIERPTTTTAPPCEECQQPATNSRNIGGVHAFRCDACAALALRQEAEDQAEASAEDAEDAPFHRPDRALCDRAETLGAQVQTQDITSLHQRADGRLPVLPPATHNQQWLHCDADELRELCEAWERSAPATTATTGNARSQAAALLRQLAPLMRQIETEQQIELSQAIADLNECGEGTEAQHWLAVGWALLDLEATENEVAE